MKTFTAVVALAAVSSVQAFDGEFMRGAQTGIFITNEEQFEDYSCPRPMTPMPVQNFVNMAMPMKMMAQNMN